MVSHARDHIKPILMVSDGLTSNITVSYLMAKLQAEVRKNTPMGQEMVKEENLASMAYI